MPDQKSAERSIAVFQDADAMSRDAAYRFTAIAAQKAAAGQLFSVALAGGSTPKKLYMLLASPEFREGIAWNKVHFFFGDERCVPPDSPDSNFHMAQETLFGSLPVPAANIHRMPAEMADPNEAARRSEEDIRTFFGLQQGTLPRFHLILLGMGPDGHTASLFPHFPSLQESDRLVVETEAGLKPFVPRLSLTLPVLTGAEHVLFLVAGEDKAETAARVLEGPADSMGLPSQSVVPRQGTLLWMLDRGAAHNLTLR